MREWNISSEKWQRPVTNALEVDTHPVFAKRKTPLLQLGEFLIEINDWWKKIIYFIFSIHQNLLTFIFSFKLVTFYKNKDNRVLLNTVSIEKVW